MTGATVRLVSGRRPSMALLVGVKPGAGVS